jgi:hypothetical protein
MCDPYMVSIVWIRVNILGDLCLSISVGCGMGKNECQTWDLCPPAEEAWAVGCSDFYLFL